MNNIWTQLGSLVMLLGVALGAFGSHILKGKISDYYLDVFKTGVLYQFIHGLALFFVFFLSTQSQDPKIQYAGIFFVFGIILFPGSLYTLSITGIKWIGAITPLGGVAFIIGWTLLFFVKT